MENYIVLSVCVRGQAVRQGLRLPHLAKYERDTPISCTRLYSMAACAAFIKESRMKLVEPTGLNRKSGVWGTL
jgi:hypothetical protein